MSTRSRALAHAEGAAGPEICAHCFQLVTPRRVCILCTQRSANHLTCVATALGLGADGVDGPFDKMVPRLMCGDHPLAGVFARRQMCKPCSLMWARTQIVRVAQQPVCGACPSHHCAPCTRSLCCHAFCIRNALALSTCRPLPSACSLHAAGLPGKSGGVFEGLHNGATATVAQGDGAQDGAVEIRVQKPRCVRD